MDNTTPDNPRTNISGSAITNHVIELTNIVERTSNENIFGFKCSATNGAKEINAITLNNKCTKFPCTKEKVKTCQ